MQDTNLNKSVVTPIKEGLQSAESAGERAIEDLKVKAALAASRLQVGFLKASGGTREWVHRRPITALVAGAGAGYLLGALMGIALGRFSSKAVQP